ncbi:hypothetical protein K474DRAFT_44763 [Panus rudis PR-1116 ss-1]|nr:hypothetical protein K474DRAFT_44763 [Panus rudis PR-1116 ss-1]
MCRPPMSLSNSKPDSNINPVRRSRTSLPQPLIIADCPTPTVAAVNGISSAKHRTCTFLESRNQITNPSAFTCIVASC